MRDVDHVQASMTHHTPSPEDGEKIGMLRGDFQYVARAINQFVPDGRAKSIAYTKLEEALMWATKGIAIPDQ